MKPLHVTNAASAMLEWPAFLDFYSSYAASPAGREQALAIRPVENIEDEIQLTSEALACAIKDQIPSLGRLENIAPILHHAAIENEILEGVELYRIYRLVSLGNEVRSYASGWGKEFPGLHALCTKLPDLRTLEHEIESKIEPTGEVKEDATPELIKLLRQIENVKTRVEHLLERFFRDSRYATILQENYVTYRHGRAVLLVRSDNKGAIRGVVHGQSGSGASLFLEPFNVLEINNELAQLIDQQSEETARILRELTAMAGAEADLLLFVMNHLARLDLLFARGRFGKEFRCVAPVIAPDLHFRLLNARHPLLEATLRKQNREVTPSTLEMAPDKKALVVTGPNTGGKTVFLKTAGLLSMMAYCALPLPADEGTLIPRLSAIAVDIGDQQSISESLSTFSSHMRNIREIMANLEDGSLVLLDELGTGTDPEEGAPLAVAILQEFLKRNIKTVITSHHSQMKVFAVNDPRCLVAAMEFDEQNLQPTYRVHLEQVGSSHAFEIAQRLGLPEALLQNARSMLGDDRRQIKEFQDKLQERIRALTERQQALETEKSEWETTSLRQQQKLDTLQKKLEDQLKKLRDENTDFIRTIHAKVENLIEAIQDAQVRQQIKKKYKEEVAPAITKLDELTAAPVKEESFLPGERVWVNLYKEFGTVAGIKKNQAEILIRNIRFTVPITTLERRESVQQTLPKGVQVQFEQKNVERELNVIGRTVEEALELTDKYLDDAILAQLPEVRIIHGHGMGKLKKAVAELLTGHPHVRGFRSETPQRGGAGVTVVELKSL